MIQLHYNSTDSNFFVNFRLLDQVTERRLSASLGSFTDQCSGISFVQTTAEVTKYPIPTSAELEQILERLKKRDNRSDFSNDEILQEMVNMQNEI